mgnify:CR=1 FL=1
MLIAMTSTLTLQAMVRAVMRAKPPENDPLVKTEMAIAEPKESGHSHSPHIREFRLATVVLEIGVASHR